MLKRERAIFREVHLLGLTVSALLLPAVAVAQAPPDTKTPVAPKVEQLDPNACAQPDTRSTVGAGGANEGRGQEGNPSDKLAQSGGVICPPAHVDPEIEHPTPTAGPMPVIPPPGSPHGAPSVQPK